jgi:hypothetical protein
MEGIRADMNRVETERLNLQRQMQQQQQNTGARGDIGLPGAEGVPGGASLGQEFSNKVSQVLPDLFNTSFKSLTSTLTQSLINGGDLLGLSLISSLNTAFIGFRGPVQDFKNASDKFITDLKKFNSDGGIKGPNIPQEVTVTVTFDENLVVEANGSNNNESLLTQIGILVNEAVERKLTELRVFGGSS